MGFAVSISDHAIQDSLVILANSPTVPHPAKLIGEASNPLTHTLPIGSKVVPFWDYFRILNMNHKKELLWSLLGTP